MQRKEMILKYIIHESKEMKGSVSQQIVQSIITEKFRE